MVGMSRDDIENLQLFFDGFILSEEDITYHTGYDGEIAKEILDSIKKLRDYKL